jgi:hypothetical protein
MRDWKTLLSIPGFRGLWLALVSDSLGSWCVIASLPILVAQSFGAGDELVISLASRVLPRILLAPAAGAVLRHFGPTRVAVWTLGASGVLTALLPWCRDFSVLQIAILTIGILDVFVGPALLVLRTPVTPRGLEMAGNTLFFSADRLAKFAGPGLAALTAMAGFPAAYFAFGAAMLVAAGCIERLPARAGGAPDGQPVRAVGTFAVLRDFAAMLRGDGVLRALAICAVPYMVTYGGMRPFLFWANAEWFGASDAAWTVLLSAQGIGAIVGASVCGIFCRAMLRAMSVYELMLAASLLEGLSHVSLLFASGTGGAVLLLILGGIPEMLAYAAYFTCIQQRLPPNRQAVFYSMQQPLLDLAFLLGTTSAGLHADGMLTLGEYWALLSLFSTLPVVALAALHLHAGRAEMAPSDDL